MGALKMAIFGPGMAVSGPGTRTRPPIERSAGPGAIHSACIAGPGGWSGVTAMAHFSSGGTDMGLLDTIMGQGNNAAIGALAKQFGINPDQAAAVMKHITPALGAGVKKNTQSDDGLAALMGALGKGNHAQYLDNAAALLGKPETQTEGNAILGHLFGSKEVSREVAANAAAKTGVDVGTIKKMLPLAATMFMGGLGKQQQQGGLGGMVAGLMGGKAPAPEPKQSRSMLAGLLDQDGDGNMLDDVLGMAKKFF